LQLSFNFPFQEKHQPEEFLISSCNKAAFDFVQNFNISNQELPKIFAIKAPKFSGKTYLSKIWAKNNNAEFLHLDDLEKVNLIKFVKARKFYIIEDIEKVRNLELLLQIFNLVQEKMAYLMITSSTGLERLGIKIKDLNSRLKNVFQIEISKPDDELIKMLLIKNFSSKQLKVEDKVADFIAVNLSRDFASIADFSKLLEFYSLEKKRNITIPLVKEIL
jgi:chromosomal replication initiation ATPase DnaA